MGKMISVGDHSGYILVAAGSRRVDLATARKLLGKDAIIGVTACNSKEARDAIDGGANYLGLGTVFATQTYVFMETSKGRG